ncbi:amino acid ABC transporter ATP-binding protein [Oribacterium sinus]|uniref:ABC transporter, ATP-binding protein n=2 Tax=Oribacterium sinus TaxID=237576 RepID=C2KZM3_9FIRM|nr:amino acid ABC transporter ATP-binding protein [Oribacterium sinus]EEJ50791.1 ABC transporter, ATP-binding protein [Oribacterium sinus F0268]MBF1272138.1 amino acid ABC transporter ATP-binding protein [Oribacterium sinus]
MAKEVLIEIEHLSKSFPGGTEVLKDISLEIHKGDIVAIIGPSGTGKSTLLRCLNYLTVPSEGKIRIGECTVDAKSHTKEEVYALRRKSSMVFQQFNLFKNKTALENVMEALTKVQKMPKAEAEEISKHLLEQVGMGDRMDFYPSKLSGGQQQRVGIARALAVNPEVILFDEPTSALDPEWVKEVLATIQEVAKEGRTMLIVTHEISFARQVANRILFMEEGKIQVDAPPEEFFSDTKQERLQQFLSFVRREEEL